MSETDIGPAERAALREIALGGDGVRSVARLSCSSLAARLGVSDQTASRRLRRLEAAGRIERETERDGQRVTVTEAGRRTLRAEYEAYRRLFEGTAGVELSGRVTGGMGEGRHYVTLPGYMEQFRGRLGYEPFPGTLNVALDDASVERRAGLDALDPVAIDGWEDDERTYGPAVCYPATLQSDGGSYEDAHVIAPERTHHDADQLEVIAPDELRAELDLDDDDRVTVDVTD